MRITLFGGAGFVGLNLAAVLLARGHHVTLFDRQALSAAAQGSFTDGAQRISAVQGDVTDKAAVESVIAQGCDGIVLGAAITAGAERDASDPESILQVNLLAQIPILQAARRQGVGRVINLSSAAAYGAAGQRCQLLREEMACDPISLYSITKFASERAVARLAELWDCDFLSVRLSGVFGPWESIGGLRDTPSPHAQILAAFDRREPALLPRPGVKDWIYATDVAEALALLLEAPRPRHRLYNISSGTEWSALRWGEAFAALHNGFECRLAASGEAVNVDPNGSERAPLAVERMAQEFGWRARFGCADSAADLSRWWIRYRREDA
jgi:UDP-glucose 4-epimerase